VLLGAIATRTERIKLGTAVTVLSTDDPVRVYERFSTLDAASNGVRMALGAQASRVQRMVVGQGAQVLVVGVAIGLAVAAASTRALRSLLFGVGALDPATFAVVAGAMVLVGLLAVYLPARRASRVDPMESLRGE
jgi:predicted lysophospholipase L1 biosynthesis ABC-type transport system permease subunit